MASVWPMMAFFAAEATSASVNVDPVATFAVVTSKYSGVVPITEMLVSDVVVDDTVRLVDTCGTTCAT